MKASAPDPLRLFPIAECVRRGLGTTLVDESGAILHVLPDGNQMLYASDLELGESIVRTTLRPTLVTLITPGLAGVVESVLGLRTTQPFHLAIYQTKSPIAIDSSRDLRTLDPSFADAVRAHYSHPEFFTVDEIRARLAAKTMIGAFDGDDLVGFVGQHGEGSIGMLEVFEGHRRHGWAEALEAAMINEHLTRGWTPWGQVFKGNEASLRLQEKLGLTITPAEEQCFISDDEAASDA